MCVHYYLEDNSSIFHVQVVTILVIGPQIIKPTKFADSLIKLNCHLSNHLRITFSLIKYHRLSD